MKYIVLLSLLAVFLVAPAFPKASAASLSGTVRDQTGAVIVAASVLLSVVQPMQLAPIGRVKP